MARRSRQNPIASTPVQVAGEKPRQVKIHTHTNTKPVYSVYDKDKPFLYLMIDDVININIFPRK